MGTTGRNLRGALAIGIAAFAAACWAPAASAAPPPNDDFANATVLGPALPVAVAGTTQDATGPEPGETSHTGIPVNPPPTGSVWYRWTPTEGHAGVILDICDNTSTPPSIFLNVAVYTGSTLATLGDPIAVGGGFTDSPGACKITFDANAGTTYRIAIDIPQAQGYGDFTLRLRLPSPPANDDYEDAQVVGPSVPVSVPATTIDATWQANEPGGLGGSLGSRSVWFDWTAPASGQYRADGCDWEPRSGDSNRAIEVTTDANNSLPVDASVASDDECQVDFNATAGQRYRIAFSGAVFGEGDFTFRIRATAPPSNDNFANALTVGPSLPLHVDAHNDFATKQAGEPGHGGGGGQRSVWFKWTPTAAEAGLVSINACNTNVFESLTPDLGVYTGTAVNALTPVGTAPGGKSPYCWKQLNAVTGTTYRIAVSSSLQVGDEGDFTLDIHKPDAPDNDDFADAATIGPALPVAVNGTTVDGTPETGAGENTHSGFNDPYHSVWYRWTAPATEHVTVSTCGATFETALAVYQGLDVGDLDEIVTADESSCGDLEMGSSAEFNAAAGQTYLIAVDAMEPGYWGTFALIVDGPSGHPTPPPGDPPVTDPKPKPPFNLKAALKKCKKYKKKAPRKKCIKKARKRAAQG